MRLAYTVVIEDPARHVVRVRVQGPRPPGAPALSFFLPRWSPGSYLLREYARNIRSFKAETPRGRRLFHRQAAGSVWEVRWDHADLPPGDDGDGFLLTYDVLAHEPSVRTSHVDASHAFLHGPSLLMGVLGRDVADPVLEVVFPPLWSKVTTSLRDASPDRTRFIYGAPDYDHLIDCPLEVGCHETDGFLHAGREHHVSFQGAPPPAPPGGRDLKADLERVVATTCGLFPEVPYGAYWFMHRLAPGAHGGLEHRDSTAIEFCPKRMASRQGWLDYLALAAHEHFHAWNGKRIRPRELGPFDYLAENHTTMLWLVEGLTAFMEDLVLLRGGLCSLGEYLERRTRDVNRLLATPGRRFQSLEESSFNAWTKLYRPDSSTNNAAVSYYLKGSLVFLLLQADLAEAGRDISDLLRLLWERHKADPATGLATDEVLDMAASLAGAGAADALGAMVSGTEELDLEARLGRAGLAFERAKGRGAASPGFKARFEGDRVFVSEVPLGTGAFRSGVNAGDEVLALAGLRFTRADMESFAQVHRPDRPVPMTVARQGRLLELDYTPTQAPPELEKIIVTDEALALRTLLGPTSANPSR